MTEMWQVGGGEGGEGVSKRLCGVWAQCQNGGGLPLGFKAERRTEWV